LSTNKINMRDIGKNLEIKKPIPGKRGKWSRPI
jgi:hypothetical protein